MTAIAEEEVRRPSMRWIVCLLIAGTLVRLAYGLLFTPWFQQPDQLAWGLVIDASGPDAPTLYQRLIHYPHEGGSILLSLLALATGPVGDLPALSVAALVVDTLSRLVQLLVVRRFFPAAVLWWFAAWTVIPLPGLLPWGVVNYGLHALAAFIPFVVLWLSLREHAGRYGHPCDGLMIAALVWFSYSTIALAPLYLLFRRDLFARPARWGTFLLGLVAMLGLHAAVRTAVDPGFHLPGFAGSTIRGVPMEALGQKFVHQGLDTWISSFPGASMLPSILGLPVVFVRRAWALILLTGFVAGVLAWKKDRTGERRQLFCLLAVCAFGLAYAASPFFHPRPDRVEFVHYRHWAFILPITTLAAIGGLCSLRLTRALLPTHALLCAIGVILAFARPRSDEHKYKETGYVLSMKFGHDPVVLSAIARGHPEARADLLRGAGWGTAEVLLAFQQPTQADLDTLAALVPRYPQQERRWFREGLALGLSRDAMHALSGDLREQVRALVPSPRSEQ